MSEIKYTISVQPTKDGSTTLYSSRFGQHYHNPNGAVAESRHVFFDTPGIPDAINRQTKLNIFETGFGTGLSLLLLMQYLNQSINKPIVTLFSVEAFPIDAAMVKSFDFGDNPGLNQSKELLAEIFQNLKPGLNHFQISENLTLKLYSGLFDNLFENESIQEKFHFFFHDPFSPEANPDLWTPEVFKKLASVSHHDAILSTYCAASAARAAMAVSGWHLAKAQGALGKREMTVASINPEKLAPFKRINEKRLIERFKRGDFAK